MTGRYAFLVATPAPKCASIAGSALFPSPPPSYGAGWAKTPPVSRTCPAMLRLLYGKQLLTGFAPMENVSTQMVLVAEASVD